MTPERIAEIEELAATKAPMVYVRAGSIRELCRLARLGMRVEGAPTAGVVCSEYGYEPDNEPRCTVRARVDTSWVGKRVALVVLES